MTIGFAARKKIPFSLRLVGVLFCLGAARLGILIYNSISRFGTHIGTGTQKSLRVEGSTTSSLVDKVGDYAIDIRTSAKSGATGSLFSGKPFRTFPGEPKFQDWTKLRSGTSQNDNPFHLKNASLCTKWSVVTTIFEPSEAVLRAAQLSIHGWCMVIVADLVTPEDYMERAGLDQNPNVHFLSVDYQKQISKNASDCAVSAFVRAVPWRHFSRKNIGYMYAMANKATYIFDFDDDNILDYADADLNGTSPVVVDPVPEHWNAVRVPLSAKNALNHHPLMGLMDSWPRGFPLDEIQDMATQGPVAFDFDMSADEVPNKIAVMQYCVNSNPDVDAIHRLVKPLPLNFDPATSSLMIPPYTFAPYNAQATVHTIQSLFALLLPSTVPGRVSDIWRSYFSQVLFFPLDLAVIFLPPRLVQDRNEHEYLGDFRAELDLYFKASTLLEHLSSWEPTSVDCTTPARMEALWINLYEHGYIELDDVHLLQLWLAALTEIDYSFPEIPRQRQKRHHNVVIMGQFNHPLPADYVVFWTQHWRQLFPNIVVCGPFDEITVQELQGRGVQVYESSGDRGFYSPMTNLAATLLQFYEQQQRNDTYSNIKPEMIIEGVLYIHDDGMLNISAFLGNDSLFLTDTIIGSQHWTTPYAFQDTRNKEIETELSGYGFRVYPNGTLSTGKVAWGWWDCCCMPGIYEVMAMKDDPKYHEFLEPDGSFVMPSLSQSDFLYVPIKYAREFHAAAEVVARHQIFLECGLPIIVDYIVQHQQVHLQMHKTGSTGSTTATKKQVPSITRTVELCTTFDTPPGRGTDQMYTTCRDDTEHSYGMYHPFKLTTGFARWSNLFHCITFDDDSQWKDED